MIDEVKLVEYWRDRALKAEAKLRGDSEAARSLQQAKEAREGREILALLKDAVLGEPPLVKAARVWVK